MSYHEDSVLFYPDALNKLNLTDEEREQLTSKPSFSNFQRQKLERDAKKNWDLFYKRNGGRFFKSRYWIRHEFKELFETQSSRDEIETGKIEGREMRRFLEVGCGCGDMIAPILGEYKTNTRPSNNDADNQACDISMTSSPIDLFVYCCDISDQAIELVKNSVLYQKHHPERLKAFVIDITNSDADTQILVQSEGLEMDIVSLVFVLSALDPDKMVQAIANVHKVLKEGGLVLFRDYAIYDKAMLRFNRQSKICDQFYARQDGTRAYFFEKEQLLKLFKDFNFHCQSIEYVQRETVNNATKDKFSRTFLQAKFEKRT